MKSLGICYLLTIRGMIHQVASGNQTWQRAISMNEGFHRQIASFCGPYSHAMFDETGGYTVGRRRIDSCPNAEEKHGAGWKVHK